MDDVLLNKAAAIERAVRRVREADRMKRMVDFRNIAVHDYQRLDIEVVRSIVHERLGDLEAFARLLVQRASSGSGAT